MARLILMVMFAAGASTPNIAKANALGAEAAVAEPDTIARDTRSGPLLPPQNQHWPGATVIVILGLFLAAAVIGPVVHANTPRETIMTTSSSTTGHPPQGP